jgi:16S rRNA (cytidine1402-2'-O)-methyltransferase
VSGRLILVPNLLGVAAPSDVLPQRTIEAAQRLQHFVVETPKVARAFLKTLSPERVIADITMIACNDANAVPQCLAWLSAGIDVGVISDAGCPGMADPGAVFVAAAHQAKISVVPLVGPSSLLLGLMASGLNGQHITFHGYLPAKPMERDSALKALDRAIHTTNAKLSATQAFIETPYRNATMLAAILQNVASKTVLCVAQNLASEGERIVAKPVDQWSKQDADWVGEKSPALFLLGQFATP